MKYKPFAMILSLLIAVILSACSSAETENNGSVSDDSGVNSPESLEESRAVAENSQSDSAPAESSDGAASDASDTTEASQTDDNGESFMVVTEHGTYSFFSEEKRGSYKAEFNTVTDEDTQKLNLLLTDGRTVELNYGDIVYDEEEMIYKTEINGFTFWIEEFNDGQGRLCQALECIELTERTIFVLYYPELDHGTLEIYFDFEAEGDTYTLNYADGNSSVKTILFDEESGEYYFG